MDEPDLTSMGTPIKDQGVTREYSYEKGTAGLDHHFEASYIGLRFPKRPKRPGKHKHHHHHHHHKNKDSNHVESDKVPSAVETFIASMTPSEQIQHLIGDNETETHKVFCQMDTLHTLGFECQWREAARWVKYEEDVEDGGERWSKPHVASLSLHSLFELRSSLLQGGCMLDVDAFHIGQIADMLLDNLVNNKLLEESLREQIRHTIVASHAHQHQKRRRSMMPSELAAQQRRQSVKRTFSEIGRSLSMKSRDSALRGNPNSVPNMENMNGDLPESASSAKLNQNFMRKIPEGSEAANIMVGELEYLKYQVAAFIRLTEGRHVGDLSEVPIPTRFIYILLGPPGSAQKNFEMGRSMATIMVDEVFREVAYKARTRQDLLFGIDEFLDQVTVLPPGEWDPKIRIEPPDSVPSQEPRKLAKHSIAPSQASGLGDAEAGAVAVPGIPEEEEEEHEGHGDPTLVRTGRVFGGLIADVKRKIPWYASDFKDCLHIQCVASVIYLFLATLTPNVTFGGLLGQATDQYMGTMECILTASIVGILFALFAGQPLNILGSTGPMLVLEMILYNVCKEQKIEFMPFRCWVGIWTALLILLIVAFDLSALVRYITRFTEESFASLIALIFIFEAFKKVFSIIKKYPITIGEPDYSCKDCFCSEPMLSNDTLWNVTTQSPVMVTVAGNNSGYSILGGMLNVNYSTLGVDECLKYNGTLLGDGCDLHRPYPDVFFFSILLFLGTFVIAIAMSGMKTGRFFPSGVRQLCSDFAVLTAIIVMVLFDFLVGINTPKLIVPSKFAPTRPGRPWVISPIHPNNPWWIAIVAAAPAILATILVFMDQQITAVIVNRKENKLKKGNGYHLDLAVVGICIVICSFLGLPWYVAATVSAIAHIMSLKKESECTAPGEKPQFLGVREQRVTALLVGILSGLAVFLTKILGIIPMPVLYGVFLYMGVAALKGMQFVDRLMLIFMPAKYQPDRPYLRHVTIKKVHLFTFIQVLCLVVLWVIKTIKSISIVFPMMVAGTCFVRMAMKYIFTQRELKWLDDIMPEEKRNKQDKKKKKKGGDGNEDDEEKEDLLTKTPMKKHSFDERVNITEEMSKTSIWMQVRRDSARNLNGGDVQKLKAVVKGKSHSDNNGQKAAFYFAGDDDHDHEKLKPLPEDSESRF